MITITEKKLGNEVYYIKTVVEGSKTISEQRIHPQSATVTRNGKDYFLLYNSDMVVDSEAFNYINVVISERSHNTQIKAVEALKFLLAFEELIGKSLPDFLPADVTSLKYFLHGYSPEGQTYTLNLTTVRSNDTVNGYLSVYRGFLQYLGIDNHPLFQTSAKLSKSFQTPEMHAIKSKSYRTSERSPKKFVEVPKYISVDEFVKILEYVRANYPLAVEIIIRLMYQCGLRIGEVLGLTADDLVMLKSDALPQRTAYDYQSSYVPIAFLRNRVSDTKDRLAKSCMKVVSKRQYQTEDYNTYNYGYQFVVVPQDLFDLINEYIESEHVAARENSHDRYYEKTIADRVRPSEDGEDDNYYIFINSIGTPLSVVSWNTTLREIFDRVGIVVDSNKRKNNLNHRFRHGFAMFNVLYCHTDAATLADLLRHRSLGSVMCYYNPTISEQIALKTSAIEDMYDAIPALKREDR